MPNYEDAFAGHPVIYEAWETLSTAIREGLGLRRYELATLAAARTIRSSYCSLAHGRLMTEALDLDIPAIVADAEAAGLSAADRAVMALAEQVARDATAVTEQDRQRLLDLGMTDHEVELVVMAAAARCFFAKTLDGVGALPDREFADLPQAMLDVLVVGRPIERT